LRTKAPRNLIFGYKLTTMKRPLALGGLILGLLLGTTGISAHAVEGRYALIVGIGNYSEASNTPPLKGAPRDVDNARKMALAIGVDPASITELRDSAATKPRILRELAKLQDTVKPGDRVFIYWTGHGSRYAGPNGCVEGLQTYTDGVFTQADVMSEAELAVHLQPISKVADKVLTVMDACFSGGVIKGSTRGLLESSRPQAKFNDQSGGQCDVGINQPRTRSLLSEISRLGVRQENFVQIAAAADNEVSWDSEVYGGIATNALAQCLLGEARDLNSSGAVSLEEVRICAQVRMNSLMEPYRQLGMAPSTLQIKGNRNLVIAPATPAQALASRPPVDSPPPAPLPPTTTVAVPPRQPIRTSDLPGSVATPPQGAGVIQSQPVITSIQEPLPPSPIGSRGTLEDIFNQRDPRIQIDVSAPKQLTIGRDRFAFSVKPSNDGYLYAVLLGSDEKSFYLLFPNKLDADNRVKANQTYSMPRAGWQVGAAGPEGTDRILFVLSQSPRDPKIFASDDSSAGGPFSYSVADFGSRQRLLDFFLGKGVKGRNAAMGAAMIEVEEVR
jgi:hypothetical protein